MVRLWRGGFALCPTSPPRLQWPLVRMRHRGGNVLRDQAFYERLRASPLNPMESGDVYSQWRTFAHVMGFWDARLARDVRQRAIPRPVPFPSKEPATAPIQHLQPVGTQLTLF